MDLLRRAAGERRGSRWTRFNWWLFAVLTVAALVWGGYGVLIQTGKRVEGTIQSCETVTTYSRGHTNTSYYCVIDLDNGPSGHVSLGRDYSFGDRVTVLRWNGHNYDPVDAQIYMYVGFGFAVVLGGLTWWLGYPPRRSRLRRTGRQAAGSRLP